MAHVGDGSLPLSLSGFLVVRSDCCHLPNVLGGGNWVRAFSVAAGLGQARRRPRQVLVGSRPGPLPGMSSTRAHATSSATRVQARLLIAFSADET